MTVLRESMSELIEQLRLKIGDPESASPVFSDEELQGFLDERSAQIVQGLLRPFLVSSGSPQVYAAPYGWWEGDAVIAAGGGTVLTVSSADPLTGHWTFASGNGGPVYVTGRVFDLYGAAVAALEAWQAKVAGDFDFASDGQRFDRSQKRRGLEALANQYSRKANWPLSPWMA